MRHTLFLKFIGAYLLFGFLGLFILSTLGGHLLSLHLTQKEAKLLYQEANYISTNFVRNYYTQKNSSSLETLYSHFDVLDSYLNGTLYLLDSSGNVLIDSSEPFDHQSNMSIENFVSLNEDGSYYNIGNFYGKSDVEVLSVTTPIIYNFKTNGHIIINVSMSSIIAERDAILNICLVIFLIIFILSLLILGIFTIYVYFPLKKITIAATQYASGDFSYKIPVYSEDEIGTLSATMNYMAQELQEMDDYQRKFVSNISHDFRSPLTSIKGYVEAIQDGTIPPEMQEKYLGIVLMETNRLNKLTSGLLTLNSFDTKRNRLDITTFDINAIIKNTVASFEGSCMAKEISIELLFDSKQEFVKADMGKIQQVIYNLLDNAIKFSHNDSTIILETTLKHEKVLVSIKDTGIGIPKDSLKKVWERFYKSDLSRGKDKKGTGLGLAIVKEIINTHDEHINVISTEGVGTEFIFSLPRVNKGE